MQEYICPTQCNTVTDTLSMKQCLSYLNSGRISLSMDSSCWISRRGSSLTHRATLPCLTRKMSQLRQPSTDTKAALRKEHSLPRQLLGRILRSKLDRKQRLSMPRAVVKPISSLCQQFQTIPSVDCKKKKKLPNTLAPCSIGVFVSLSAPLANHPKSNTFVTEDFVHA